MIVDAAHLHPAAAAACKVLGEPEAGGGMDAASPAAGISGIGAWNEFKKRFWMIFRL